MPIFSETQKEKLHWILYDRNPGYLRDGDGSTFEEMLGSGNTLAFFQDVQRKTKLETNMDTSGMLSRNTYEVRAMRVVIAPMGGDGDGSDDTPVDPGAEPGTPSTSGGGSFDPTVIDDFIYNSVTSLRVGEKIYIEAPSFMFPAGAGAYGGTNYEGASHGEPNPLGTFRFAEPIMIPPQQSFRVEINFPHGVSDLEYLKDSSIAVWVVLDGYLVRDVQ